MIYSDEHKSLSFKLCSYIEVLIYSSYLGLNILQGILFSKTVGSCVSLTLYYTNCKLNGFLSTETENLYCT
jgi:hypothetical protein